MLDHPLVQPLSRSHSSSFELILLFYYSFKFCCSIFVDRIIHSAETTVLKFLLLTDSSKLPVLVMLNFQKAPTPYVASPPWISYQPGGSHHIWWPRMSSVGPDQVISITHHGWRHGVVVSGVRRMNEVNARQAQLVPGWVTIFGRVYHLGM